LRLLFCATDPGGAACLAPVVKLALKNHDVIVLASEITKRIFHRGNINSEIIDCTTVDDAAQLLKRLQPDAAILGTAAPERAEAKLTIAGRNLGIWTVAVLDEWYRYQIRFGQEDGAMTHVPDVICVQDELALTEAVAEGVPASPIRITGSPSLATYADTVENLVAQPAPGRLADDGQSIRLLFVSERIAQGHGRAPGEHGIIGSYCGFTEETVRNEIADALGKIDIRFRVLEKMHPNESNVPSPPDALHTNTTWQTITDEESLDTVLAHCDIVVGMQSVALLEATLFGHRPISYQPGLIGMDTCTAARTGLAVAVRDYDGLLRNLEAVIKSGQGTRVPISLRPGFADPAASERVLQAALERAVEVAK
jgi:hypothetical protein